MEKRIEELSINAWPPMQTMVYDGWMLRFCGGYTRRTNSISPLYVSNIGFEEKIKKCEQLYSSMGLNTTFKIMNRESPDGLDKLLHEHGYKEDAKTSVQVLELADRSANVPNELVAYSRLDEGWFRRLCNIKEVNDSNAGMLRCILSSIVPERYFAELAVDGRIVGCGVGVIEDGHIGLFDIVIASEFRGRGYGRKLMEAMLSLGKSKGADRAYLQVMLDNPVALKLYESLGFRELYQYWYRVKKYL